MSRRQFDLRKWLFSKDSKAQVSEPNVTIRCPGCEERKLCVLIRDKSTHRGEVKAGAWLCYKCKEFGRSIESLVSYVEGVPLERATQYVKDNSENIKDIDVMFANFFHEEVGSSKPNKIPSIQLPAGYTPVTTKLTKLLKIRGLTLQQCVRHGIGLCGYGLYRGRIIVPVFKDGKIVSFVARYAYKKVPPGVKKVLYHKKITDNPVLSCCLFNYDRARKCKQIVITEDVFSAIRVGKNAVATYGTTLSYDQELLLEDSAATSFVLMWDRDALVQYMKCGITEERKKALRGSPCNAKCPHCKRYFNTQIVLERLANIRPTRFVVLPDSRDPKDWPRSKNRRFVKKSQLFSAYSALKAALEATFR